MIDELKIENFKCFQRQRLPLADLTVLVGANGAGKSSVMQSMLLLRQSIETPNSREIRLNGPYGLSLGTDGAICNQTLGYGKTKISLRTIDNRAVLHLSPRGGSANFSTLAEYKKNPRDKVGFFAQEFYFLSAERTGPRISQPMTSLWYSHTGIYGEYTAQVLSNRFMKIDELRKHNSSQSSFLLQQVNAWLNSMMPGVEVKADSDTEKQVAQVMIRNGISDDFVYSTNIGFGISYALPIIVTGLVAKVGSYMLVENPEAHLHPAAQSAMGKFLAMLAKVGVRVVIETHSNHIVDGIQIYAAQNRMPQDSVLIHNFEINNWKIKITPIRYNEKYAYDKWPKGFMDQTSRDYLEYYHSIKK